MLCCNFGSMFSCCRKQKHTSPAAPDNSSVHDSPDGNSCTVPAGIVFNQQFNYPDFPFPTPTLEGRTISAHSTPSLLSRTEAFELAPLNQPVSPLMLPRRVSRSESCTVHFRVSSGSELPFVRRGSLVPPTIEEGVQNESPRGDESPLVEVRH
jgi:hypothetical protein